MTPDELTSLFTEVIAGYARVVGRPTEDDILDVRRTASAILRKAKNYDEVDNKHHLEGIAQTDATYNRRHSVGTYKWPAKLPLYPANVTEKTSARDRNKAKTEHESKRNDYSLAHAGDDGTKALIIATFDNEWISALKNREDGYAKQEASARTPSTPSSSPPNWPPCTPNRPTSSTTSTRWNAS